MKFSLLRALMLLIISIIMIECKSKGDEVKLNTDSHKNHQSNLNVFVTEARNFTILKDLNASIGTLVLSKDTLLYYKNQGLVQAINSMEYIPYTIKNQNIPSNFFNLKQKMGRNFIFLQSDESLQFFVRHHFPPSSNNDTIPPIFNLGSHGCVLKINKVESQIFSNKEFMVLPHSYFHYKDNNGNYIEIDNITSYYLFKNNEKAEFKNRIKDIPFFIRDSVYTAAIDIEPKTILVKTRAGKDTTIIVNDEIKIISEVNPNKLLLESSRIKIETK